MQPKHIKNKMNAAIIAHRGLSGIEPENTLSAFIAAANRSYFGIETDVHKTRDGKFICTHDDNVKRVCGVDAVVENTDYDTLRALHVLDKDGTNRCDLYLPSLSEYIGICKKYGKMAVLELKNSFTECEIRAILDEIDALDYLSGTIFIAFDPNNLYSVRKYYPEQAVQLLVSVRTQVPNFLEVAREHKFDLDAQHTMITKELLDDVHSRGGIVNVWTVDDPERAEELIAMGVDQITTNICE